MSNYPNAYDDDSTLAPVNDNIDQIGGIAINDLRDAVMQIEMALGLNIAGSASDLATRIGVFTNPDGSPNTSIIYSLGLVTLPITNTQIADNAGIPESKLALDYPTQNLFNYIRDLSKDVNLAVGWISVSGSKLEPHLLGVIYRHDLAQIDVAEVSTQFLNNVFRVNRDNTDAYTLLNDMNNELLAHQWADGTSLNTIKNIITNSGAFYPDNFAHVASGIYVDTTGFIVIPQTDNSVQSALQYIDSNSIFLLGTRIQNLYANGISFNSRSSSLTMDGYGSPIIPNTPAVAYLKGMGNQTSPIDSFTTGDDIVQFYPASNAGFAFDEQFAQVRVGDIIRVNYTGDGYPIVVQSVISEIKFNPGSIWAVRIAGKNLTYSPNAVARIDKTLFNNNKFGVLAATAVDTSNVTSIVSGPVMPSMIVGSPRGAQCLGLNFSPDEFNETHYNLYLVLYPDGNPLNGVVPLPAIDVTGNQGKTPGIYTLDSIVAATNLAFRQPGFNYRFVAFQYQGNFGIMLADSYLNASFSIINSAVDAHGAPTSPSTYPNNVIDMFPTVAERAPDPLGMGPFGSAVSSPPFSGSYSFAQAAVNATLIFTPLRRNNYYVNGAELEKMATDVAQVQDAFGDGYWVATVDGYPVNIVGPPGHVQVSYLVQQDLSASGLKPGKTLVVQPLDGYSGGVNYGRFIIQDVVFSVCDCPDSTVQTLITVYDAVHGIGLSPFTTVTPGMQVGIYFGSDSVSFNNETATDLGTPSPNVTMNRFFEVYVNDLEQTFTHERARFSTVATNTTINGVVLYNNLAATTSMSISAVSSKLRGSQTGSVSKINLSIASYNSTSGEYTGFLSYFDGSLFNNPGPITNGKIGETVRFYDQSYIDYLDVIFPFGSTIIVGQYADIQILPSLSLDEEVMLLSTCEINNVAQSVSQVTDERQFGNISEEELSTSAKDYIALPEKLLHFNGVVRGLDVTALANEFITINGGVVLVNGEIAAINPQTLTVPKIVELYSLVRYPINFALCVNDEYELVLLPITDLSLGGPTTNRIVTALNIISSNTYQIDSDKFSTILNDRKDLTILYVIVSSISGTTVTLTSYDVRRFINDSDSSGPAVLTNDGSQGNFHSLSAALNWLKFNKDFQQQLQIKGSVAITSDPGFNDNAGLIITGNGATSTLNFSAPAFISGVTFNNVAISTDSILSVNTIGVGNNVGPVVFNNCNITVNAAQGFALGPNVTFNGCTFIYNFNATFSSPFTGDLVNAYSGMMYTELAPNYILQNLILTNNLFVNVFANHFPFISLQFNDYTAVMENIMITGNTFASNTTEDLRAVIAISTTALLDTPNFEYPLNPKMINVLIDNNVCNQDQMIVISAYPSTTTTPVGAMAGSGPSPINCRISRNICGAIGYWTPANDAGDFFNAPGSFIIRDKSDSLVITQNTCKVICTMNIAGQYQPFGYNYFNGFVFHAEQGVQVPTGQVDIVGNTASWISVGCYGSTTDLGAGVSIQNNNINPQNPNFVYNYTNTVISTAPAGLPNFGISLNGRGTGGTGIENTQSIISGNILQQSPLEQNTNPIVPAGPYYYPSGIFSTANSQITNNIVNGVVSANSLIYLGSTTATYTVSNNSLIRAGQTILAYITGSASSTSSSIVTNNNFDSVYVDAAGTIFNDIGNNIPPNWNYTGNVNQVMYCAVPVYNHCSGTNTPAPNGTVIQLGSLSLHDTASFLVFSESGGSFTLPINFKLSDVLPPGVKLLYASVGLNNNDQGGTGTTLNATAGSYIFMGIYYNTTSNRIAPPSSPTAPTTGSPLAGSILDVSNPAIIASIAYTPNSAKLDTSVNNNVLNLINGTVFLNMDMSSNTEIPPFQVYTGTENEYVMILDFFQLVTVASATPTEIDISPVVLRYTWL